MDALEARVVFESAYRAPEALRGLEGFSHIWLIWQFSQAVRERWSPTVRPPRLGGNVRMGVFATRAPFRPNPIGLSCVRLEGIDYGGKDGPVLRVRGADMLNGTPVYDIKPYLPFVDSHPEATGGFAGPRARACPARGVPGDASAGPFPSAPAKPSKRSLPRTRAPPTSTTPSGSTACPSPA